MTEQGQDTGMRLKNKGMGSHGRDGMRSGRAYILKDAIR